MKGRSILASFAVIDIVAIHRSTGCLHRWYGNGSGGFGTGVSLGCRGWSSYAMLIGVGDINNDGRADSAFYSNTTRCIYVTLGEGVGRFTNDIFQIQCNQPYTILHLSGMGNLDGAGNGHGDLVGIVAASDGVRIRRWTGGGNIFMSGPFQFGTASWNPFRLFP